MNATLAKPTSSRLLLPVPEGYNLELAYKTSSWIHASTMCYKPRSGAVRMMHDLGTTVCRSSTIMGRGKLEVEWESPKKLDPEEKTLLLIQLRRIFSIDWNLKPLHDLLAGDPEMRWIGEVKLGWILRSATFFEDVVKVLLSSSCAPDQGKELIGNFVAEFGKQKAFPNPSSLLKIGIAPLRDRVKAGFRSQNIMEAAHRFVKGEFQEAELARLPFAELRRKLLSLHGTVSECVRLLMISLGRFDDTSSCGYRVTAEGKMLKSLCADTPDRPESRLKWGEWSGLVAWLASRSRAHGGVS